MKPTPTTWLNALLPPALITLGMAALAAMPALSATLELRLDAPPAPATLITGHLVHHTWRHFLYDAAVFLALGTAAARRHGCRALLLSSAATALAVSLLLPLAAPQFATYRGISAIDTALVAWVACDLLRDPSRLLRLASSATLAGILLKSGYESLTARALFVTGAPFTPVAAAHLIGAFCGLLTAALSRLPPWPGRHFLKKGLRT